MSTSPETPNEPKPHVYKEYEDPHYHDEDEMAPVEDGEQRSSQAGAASKKPPRGKAQGRRPPPPRRFYED